MKKLLAFMFALWALSVTAAVLWPEHLSIDDMFRAERDAGPIEAQAADTKISALTDGDPCQAGDQIPIARGAANFRITCGTVRYLPETMQALTSVTDSPSADANDYSPTGWDGTQPSKATIIRLTPTQSIRITGLAGGNGNDARQATLCNALDGTAGTGEIIILEHENASSTAANRFRFADRFARFILPDRCITLVYDDTIDRWRSQDDDGWEKALFTWDDMTGSAGGGIGNTTATGTLFATVVNGTAADCISGTLLETSTTQKPMGQFNCDVGSTATGRAALLNGRSTAGVVVPEQGQALFIARIAVPDLSDATDEYDVYVGCHDAIGGTSATDGFYFIYDRNASTAWQGASEDAGVQTATGAAGPTVDTNFIWFLIYITGDWDEAEFYYSQNGTAWTRSGEHTTNQPEAADMCSFGAGVVASAGTSQTARNIVVEFMGYRYDMQRGT